MNVPLGTGTIDVSLSDCSVDIATPAGGDPVDVRPTAESAFADPHGPSLADIVAPDDTVSIVVTDITRATPDDVLVDVLLDRLRQCGVVREQVSIVVGLGLHRPMDTDELAAALGPHADLAANHDPERTVAVGQVDGVDIEINETVAAADRVLATGMVEPHQYAGFSGGAKTVVIGAGGESQIGYTHGPELLSRDGVRLGRIENNPFRAFLDRAGDLAGPDFCLNVTHGPQGFLGVEAGDPHAVVRALADTARKALAIEVEDGYDAVIAGVGAPKDANLYQASRGATYVALGDHNPLDEAGRIIVPAALPEGAGDGTGEQRFQRWLTSATDANSLYEQMRQGYEPGAQRAFVLARVLRAHEVWITNSQHPDLVEDCLMHAAESPGAAIEAGSEVLVVPDAIDTLLG